jgi:hypothetical protein
MTETSRPRIEIEDVPGAGRRYGVEHSHHDRTAREAVASGTALLGECITRGHHSRDVHKAYCRAPFYTT